MRMAPRFLLLLPLTGMLLSCCLFTAPARAETPEAGASMLTSLDELHWLAGKWRGDAFGGTMEETWDAPWNGSMIGTFKLVVEGQPAFYEFMAITQDSAGSVLRLKHFNPDLTGWETQDEVISFKLLGVGDNTVLFDGLSYRLTAPDSLRILINLGHSEGEVQEVAIDCVRVSE